MDIIMIMCAGKGERAGLNKNKLFYRAGGKTILEYTLEKFAGHKILLITNPDDTEYIMMQVNSCKDIYCTTGGKTRTDSVRCGLEYCKQNFDGIDIVLIHDGARPNVTTDLIASCLESAKNYGSGVAYIPCTDTIKCTASGSPPLNRDELICLQTPQAFDFSKLTQAYDAFHKASATDDSEVYAHLFGECRYVLGDYNNYKITTSDDLKRFGGENVKDYELRIGNGYDIHKLVENRPLILGGVHIPYSLGLLGHSDADALVHSIMDSLLSAIGEGDIGCLFPDTDNTYYGADSLKLLGKVYEKIIAKGCEICSISSTIIAEKPKMAAYAAQMASNIAAVLHLADTSKIGITFNTNEGLDSLGKCQGISCHSVCLLKKYT